MKSQLQHAEPNDFYEQRLWHTSHIQFESSPGPHSDTCHVRLVCNDGTPVTGAARRISLQVLCFTHEASNDLKARKVVKSATRQGESEVGDGGVLKEQERDETKTEMEMEMEMEMKMKTETETRWIETSTTIQELGNGLYKLKYFLFLSLEEKQKQKQNQKQKQKQNEFRWFVTVNVQGLETYLGPVLRTYLEEDPQEKKLVPKHSLTIPHPLTEEDVMYEKDMRYKHETVHVEQIGKYFVLGYGIHLFLLTQDSLNTNKQESVIPTHLNLTNLCPERSFTCILGMTVDTEQLEVCLLTKDSDEKSWMFVLDVTNHQVKCMTRADNAVCIASDAFSRTKIPRNGDTLVNQEKILLSDYSYVTGNHGMDCDAISLYYRRKGNDESMLKVVKPRPAFFVADLDEGVHVTGIVAALGYSYTMEQRAGRLCVYNWNGVLLQSIQLGGTVLALTLSRHQSRPTMVVVKEPKSYELGSMHDTCRLEVYTLDAWSLFSSSFPLKSCKNCSGGELKESSEDETTPSPILSLLYKDTLSPSLVTLQLQHYNLVFETHTMQLV